MFNEAFMFFWLISVVGNLASGCVVIAGIGVVCLLVFGLFATIDDEWTDWGRKMYGRACLGVAFAALIGATLPPERAFYAGAAQYTVQATELDGTLMNLKEVIDGKIVELKGNED